MGIHVIEDFGRQTYRFTGPDAFLHCDNPRCSVPWVTGSGLVVWTIEEHTPSASRFNDRLLVACSADCLRSAQHAHERGRHHWSEPMPVADWLDALRGSLELDPACTPIGEFAGAA